MCLLAINVYRHFWGEGLLLSPEPLKLCGLQDSYDVSRILVMAQGTVIYNRPLLLSGY
jgi:hypothetical protein